MTAAAPVPVPDELSSGFWSAAARHELVVQRCGNCGWLAYPPGIVCRHCQVDPPDLSWYEVSGEGQLKSWTVIRDAFLPAFASETPYVVGDIELAEQPRLRMAARVVGLEPADLELGLPMRVTFVDLDDGLSVPHFEPAS